LSRSIVGFVVSVESYSDVRAVVLKREASLLHYGALCTIDDLSQHRRYLGLVVDVREKSPFPHLDEERVGELLRLVAERGAGRASALEVLERVLSPSQSLIRWYSVAEIDVRVLGELRDGRLELHASPPRPRSIVGEPDPSLLERLLAPGESEAYVRLGRLLYHEGVEAYLDISKFNLHVAVLGQTGSGKTETVKRIVAEYSWRLNRAGFHGGVVVVDVSGEYSGYPYTSPHTVPLLAAVIDPTAYGGPEDSWSLEAVKTLLVPYATPTVDLYAVRRMVEELSKTYEQTFQALVFARDRIALLDPEQPKPQYLARGEAASLLENSEYLVVVHPLPSTIKPLQLQQLSGSRSEYLEVFLYEAGEALGLLRGDKLLQPHLLRDIVVASTAAARNPSIASSSARINAENAASLLETVLKRSFHGWCRGNRVSPRAFEEALKSLGVRLDTYSWALYLTAPASHEDPMLDPLSEACNVDPQRVEEVVEAVGAVARLFLSLPWSTRDAITRALYKTTRVIAQSLDPALYRLLLERVVNGFTILHLAPPSRGNTDHLLAILLEDVYEREVEEYEPNRRLLLVVEEAHNLAPADEDKPTRQVLRRIAREGRKWGVSLLTVTQRPSQVDPTVLSQAATVVVLRMTNAQDVEVVKKSLESISKEQAEHLPDLEPGQAVVSGPALPQRRIPVVVKVEKLEKRQTPPQDSPPTQNQPQTPTR